MSCQTWQAKLDYYLDGELSTDEMRALDAHLRSCPSCTADSLTRIQTKRAIRTAGRRYTPSPEFRQRVQKSIAAKRRRSWNLGWRFATAAAVVLVIVGVSAILLGRQQLRREQVFTEIADLHVATLASSTPVDVISTDRHTVKPWFQGKIPFSFNLPDLQGSDFVLLGARVTYLEQTPGAHLVYQIRKHQISVFIFQEQAVRGGLSDDSGVARRASFNAATWAQDGLRYFVIADAAPEDIRNLANLLKNAARS
jgi:anti-sigma factor RsiW